MKTNITQNIDKKMNEYYDANTKNKEKHKNLRKF